MHVAKFTVMENDGTVVAHFEYNRSTGHFESVGSPSVVWQYQAPGGFSMVGDYPAGPEVHHGLATASRVLELPTREYTATTLAAALEEELNRANIFFPPRGL